MTRNNGEHSRSPYGPGIQKSPFFLFLTPEKKLTLRSLWYVAWKWQIHLSEKKILGSGTKRKVTSESVGHKENVGVLCCFGSWHLHWILIGPMCLRCHGMELIRQKRSLFWHDKNIMKFLLPSSHNLIKSQWICLLWRQGEGGHQTELTGVCNNFLCIYECNWIKSYFSLVL